MLMNKPTLLLGVLISTLGLSACQKPDSKESVQNIEQPSASSAIADTTLTLQGNTEKLDLNLPECGGQSCPEVSIDRLHTNQFVVDDIIDRAILQQLARILAISNPDQPPSVDKQQPTSTSIESNATKTAAQQMAEQVQPYVTEFLALDQELRTLGSNSKINLMVSPKILNADGPLATVVLNTSSYLGGAHGSASQTYYNFDLKHQKQVSLDDILLPQQKANLEKLAYQAFKIWVTDAKLADNMADYEKVWKFSLSNNFYLGQNGLILQYAEYEIGPYVAGLPRLEIPYAQLQSILKNQYLPATDQVAGAASEVKAQS